MSRPAHSYATTVGAPGSFLADLKSTTSRFDGSRVDLATYAADETAGRMSAEQKQTHYKEQIEKELKIKFGSENLLEALSKHPKQNVDQRRYVERELNATNRRLAELRQQLETEKKRASELRESSAYQLGMFNNGSFRAQSRTALSESETANEPEQEVESPTFLLAELLQALESEGMTADYYVNHANELVGLFKRHPTLKYDLAWSIFGLRMQMLLLSDSREVIASGYRMMRHAITDRKSLQTIRELNTDPLVIVSLVKDAKASVEREQALKFVRAFLDVKDGVQEIGIGIVRIMVAIAEHPEDRLRPLCIMTLAEMLLKRPQLVVAAGGVGVLTDAMGNGAYNAPETLVACFLHLLDLPARRRLLRSGFEIGAPFATFTEPPPNHSYDEKLAMSSKVILALFRSWTGLMTISLHDFLPVRSLVSSLYVAHLSVRTATLDLLFEILRIKPPSWSSTFLAGRRLTTYGRVTNLNANNPTPRRDSTASDREDEINLIDHFSAIVLTILLKCGLLPALLYAENDAPSQNLKRKTTLLIGEVLTLASRLLPSTWSAELQPLSSLFNAASDFKSEDRYPAVAAIYSVDSINRTLFRSQKSDKSIASLAQSTSFSSLAFQAVQDVEQPKRTLAASIDEIQFRNYMVESQVLSTVNYLKWDWGLIAAIIEGPLTNAKRLDEAMKATKFVHRLLGFLRPFKYRFSEVRNTRANQRYVRAGCNLVRVLLQTPEGSKYLAENKLLPQVAECLAQWDRMSGITSTAPLFSRERLTDTLASGYFPILGVLSSDPHGLTMLESRKIINMFYHLIELKDRDDLVTLILTNLDYVRDSHPRIILAKALISGSKNVRILGTRLLRRYAVMPMGECAMWAIRLLVAQLYDIEIAVCEVAIKILEETSNSSEGLEYVVTCRPALDHLGEIGAPLLLRFLSSSVGYHYLDGLDYITREMDDWFLGRNDSYVTMVEASLARGMLGDAERPSTSGALGAGIVEDPLIQAHGTVPPHFYKELTRTAEGCALLRAKGHFEEFANTILDFGLEDSDQELILKVKGCLWAVGNVGSSDSGSPFLDGSDVVAKIVQIAEGSEVLTLRGTAFFVLGLISRSIHGQEMLAELGWDGVYNVRGTSLGYCLPLDIGRLFNIGSWAKVQEKDPLLIASRPPAETDADPVNRQILDAVTKLGNAILWNKTAAELSALKARKAPGLRSAKLFAKVASVLAAHHFRLGACRFAIDLFDKDVLRKVVLGEPDSDDSSEEEDD